jgi:hypothetical protein
MGECAGVSLGSKSNPIMTLHIRSPCSRRTASALCASVRKVAVSAPPLGSTCTRTSFSFVVALLHRTQLSHSEALTVQHENAAANLDREIERESRAERESMRSMREGVA